MAASDLVPAFSVNAPLQSAAVHESATLTRRPLAFSAVVRSATAGTAFGAGSAVAPASIGDRLERAGGGGRAAWRVDGLPGWQSIRIDRAPDPGG